MAPNNFHMNPFGSCLQHIAILPSVLEEQIYYLWIASLCSVAKWRPPIVTLRIDVGTSVK
jgi:hypothetical protein